MVVEKIKGALRIKAVDQRASKLGLRRGLTLADARARIPDLAVADTDAHADSDFISHLAVLCDRYTPSVAIDGPDGLILDITGCAHLFGDEINLKINVSDRISRMGLSLRATIAGTPDAARALARFSRIEIAPLGQDEALVSRLPAAAITGLGRETVLALSRAGLKTIGDLSERPPQALAARFGQNLITQLIRTLGQEDARITPLRPVPAVVVERHFAEPIIQAEALEDVLAALIEDATLIMQERDEGGRVFEAIFFRSDGDVRRLMVQTGRPCRDGPAILRLYCERLHTLSDEIDPGFGFDAMRLVVPVTESLKAMQPHLDGHGIEDNAAGNLIDQLIVRFGRDRVLRFEVRDTHDPDRGVRLVSADDMFTKKDRAKQPNISWPVPELGQPPIRPLQLFDPPQPIETLAGVPDGPPLHFRWRRVLHKITRAEGPERIAPQWWLKTKGSQQRDYFRVEDTAGCRFWIFRQGLYGHGEASPQWFLHGAFA